MAAIISSSRDALPVCLFNENPNRLVSLWDIVNLFNLQELMIIVQVISGWQAQLSLSETMGAGNGRPNDIQYQKIIVSVKDARDICISIKLDDAAHKINISLRYIQSESMNVSSLATELRNIQEAMAVEAFKHKFLRVAKDRAEYVDSANLFGQAVSDAFPSSSADIREAGNCLATECNTAAVFHLMKAAEFALRALAANRGIKYANASLETKQWGDLLAALDGHLKDLRLADHKKWPSKDIKDAQIQFYHGALAEFRDFNEAWRRYVSHARVGSLYDRDYALSIMKHVQGFMNILAAKVSEVSSGPLYWTAL